MKCVITSILALGMIIAVNGCYTMVGVAEDEEIYSSIENEEKSENEGDELTYGYFDEEMVEDYYEENEMEQNDDLYEEKPTDFFTVFSDALSGFFSSGEFNIVFELSSNSSNDSSDSNYSDNTSRNNTGSRNYDGR